VSLELLKNLQIVISGCWWSEEIFGCECSWENCIERCDFIHSFIIREHDNSLRCCEFSDDLSACSAGWSNSFSLAVHNNQLDSLQSMSYSLEYCVTFCAYSQSIRSILHVDSLVDIVILIKNHASNLKLWVRTVCERLCFLSFNDVLFDLLNREWSWIDLAEDELLLFLGIFVVHILSIFLLLLQREKIILGMIYLLFSCFFGKIKVILVL